MNIAEKLNWTDRTSRKGHGDLFITESGNFYTGTRTRLRTTRICQWTDETMTEEEINVITTPIFPVSS